MFIESLLFIFNPEYIWKVSRVTLVFKSGDKSIFQITFLFHFLKFFKFLISHIYERTKQKQHGFLKKRFT